MTMNKERLFTELTRRFTEEGIQAARQSDSCLQVLLDGEPVGRIDRFGYSFRSTGDLDSEQANDLYYYAAHVAGVVLEYLTGLEQAPPLIADGLGDGFKLLCEFNGTVLAGKEIPGLGNQFVTWQRDFDGSGLSHGHYHDDYPTAKEDFVERSRLVNKIGRAHV